MPERPATLTEALDDLFTYHAPTPEKTASYTSINEAAKNLAATILACCPTCPDTTDAIRKVREARMMANSAIATKSGGLLPIPTSSA